METILSKRRRFLLTLGLGSLGAVVTLMAGKQPGAPAAQAGRHPASPPGRGYQLSDHVKTYYRTTEI